MSLRLVRVLSLATAVAISVVALGCARSTEVSSDSSEPGLHRSGEVVPVGDREYLLTHQVKEAPGRDGYEILEVKVDVVDYAERDARPMDLELSAVGADGSPRVAPVDRETSESGASGSGAPPFWESNRWNARQADPSSWASAEAAFTVREGETGVRVTARSADGRSEVWLVR